ncbi:hypothetical protein ACFPL7_03100 [Dongia soli]|uniref:Lipoprotein n=1 Tax=Dongia soli TaxID=600628 RepID=A0ABU5EET5_9PROT|nr:hypothetical protein [Dongia soli]MDY0884723.1 hypothetical protein [Dongia soli]
MRKAIGISILLLSGAALLGCSHDDKKEYKNYTPVPVDIPQTNTFGSSTPGATSPRVALNLSPGQGEQLSQQLFGGAQIVPGTADNITKLEDYSDRHLLGQDKDNVDDAVVSCASSATTPPCMLQLH